jgi:K+-transporting ATPase KdpF subunit
MSKAAKNSNAIPSMETIIAGLAASLLFIYLLVAMLRPERF